MNVLTAAFAAIQKISTPQNSYTQKIQTGHFKYMRKYGSSSIQ